MYIHVDMDIDMIDKSISTPLFQQIEDWIKEQIETGVLKPGDQIPSELEMVDRFLISRMTVRRAIERLAVSGVLYRIPGKGTFVAEEKTPYTPATVSSFSTTMRSLGFDVGTKVLQLDTINASKDIARDLRIEPGEQVIRLKRLRYVNQVPAAMHLSFILFPKFSGLLQEDLTREPLSMVMDRVSGLRIIKSEDYVEATLARKEEADMLDVVEDAPLLLVRGIAFVEGEIPVRTTKAVYRGDRFRFYLGSDRRPSLEIRMQEGSPRTLNW